MKLLTTLTLLIGGTAIALLVNYVNEVYFELGSISQSTHGIIQILTIFSYLIYVLPVLLWDDPTIKKRRD